MSPKNAKKPSRSIRHRSETASSRSFTARNRSRRTDRSPAPSSLCNAGTSCAFRDTAVASVATTIFVWRSMLIARAPRRTRGRPARRLRTRDPSWRTRRRGFEGECCCRCADVDVRRVSFSACDDHGMSRVRSPVVLAEGPVGCGRPENTQLEDRIPQETVAVDRARGCREEPETPESGRAARRRNRRADERRDAGAFGAARGDFLQLIVDSRPGGC